VKVLAGASIVEPVVEAGLQPDLSNGDHLTSSVFLARYEAMPQVKKAELIQNVVYMASPVSAVHHGEPDNILQGLLFYYAQSVRNTIAATNATVRLGPDDVIQPDALLRKSPAAGGGCTPDAKGYLVGPPELVAEIAASSAAIDLHEKRDSCRRAGVLEYLVWDTSARQIHWWALEDGESYAPIPVTDGRATSRGFPGLTLDLAAMVALDGRGALEVLRAALEQAG